MRTIYGKEIEIIKMSGRYSSDVVLSQIAEILNLILSYRFIPYKVRIEISYAYEEEIITFFTDTYHVCFTVMHGTKKILLNSLLNVPNTHQLDLKQNVEKIYPEYVVKLLFGK
jgi:hypothetical protein